jgi:hypothetical protein
MSDAHEVISAFLDDEPFTSSELSEALSEPRGRELLIDLIAVRQLTQTDRNAALALRDHKSKRTTFRALVGVAAVLVALVGGYFVGQRRGDEALTSPPPATRVVSASAAWQDVPPGRMQ